MILYTATHQMIEDLHNLFKEYIGSFSGNETRKFTIKMTNAGKGSTSNPYVYSWMYFKEGEGSLFSKEKGEWIENKNPNESHCQSIYIGPLSKVEHVFFTYGSEKITDKMEILHDRLDKQIKLIEKGIQQDERSNNYSFDDLSEADKKEVEDRITDELESKYSDLFDDNEQRFFEIEQMILQDEKKRKVLKIFLDEERMKKELKIRDMRIKKEKKKAEVKTK